VDSGQEQAVALVTATLNLRYGDGDAELFEEALSDATDSAIEHDAVRELAHCAATLANLAAHHENIDPLEWWSAIAKRMSVEGTQFAEPRITPISRATYNLAACSVVADEIPADVPGTGPERDLLRSQVNETINVLRRLRRRLA